VILADPLPGVLAALSASQLRRPSKEAPLRARHAVWDRIITTSSVSKEPAPVESGTAWGPRERSKARDPFVHAALSGVDLTYAGDPLADASSPWRA